jgi:hypothetical protein
MDAKKKSLAAFLTLWLLATSSGAAEVDDFPSKFCSTPESPPPPGAGESGGQWLPHMTVTKAPPRRLGDADPERQTHPLLCRFDQARKIGLQVSAKMQQLDSKLY